VFRNYREEERSDGDGKTRTVKVALRAHEIDASLETITPGWPKLDDGSVFVGSPDHEAIYLDSPTKFFAYVDGIARLDWAKGQSFITQERYYEHIRMNAEGYASVEKVPHYPPAADAFYLHRPVGGPTGRLDEFLGRFCPDTEIDRSLIKAMILT